MRYALIEQERITNIIELTEVNESDFPNAVNVHDYPVEIGDSYVGGKFYRKDVEILSYPMQFEKEKTEFAENLKKIEKTENDLNFLSAKVEAEAERGEFREDVFAELALAFYGVHPE